MKRVKVKELALIAIASGLLAFEAIVLVGAVLVVSGVRHRVAQPHLRVITVMQDSRRDRVVARSSHRRALEVRDAVAAALREAAL